ncbi:hypothetical protein R3P38DRAFT_336967 [Favolaschia claudopus]|uniref:Uncharacterized protein n=1 Tax=Favolaschia claudopus TaxID=2862362 RepID=A0AAV9ZLC5_9AGAR
MCRSGFRLDLRASILFHLWQRAYGTGNLSSPCPRVLVLSWLLYGDYGVAVKVEATATVSTTTHGWQKAEAGFRGRSEMDYDLAGSRSELSSATCGAGEPHGARCYVRAQLEERSSVLRDRIRPSVPLGAWEVRDMNSLPVAPLLVFVVTYRHQDIADIHRDSSHSKPRRLDPPLAAQHPWHTNHGISEAAAVDSPVVQSWQPNPIPTVPQIPP